MVYHNVLFKFQEGVPAAQIQSIAASLEALPAAIPQIKLIKMRENFSPRGQGHTFMLVSIFETREDLQIYAQHPAHVAIVEQQIKPIVVSTIVGDIEA